MTGKNVYQVCRAVGLAGALAMLSACASLGFDNRTPEERVSERAMGWANALLDKDVQAAWAYTSPNYREFSGWGAYYAKVEGAARWDAASIRDVRCEEFMCEVTLILEYRIGQVNVDMKRPRTYKWIEIDGEWWLHVPPN